MLLNEKDFDTLTKSLIENGKIQKFEQENGKILGRALIDFGEIPINLEEDILNGKKKEDLFFFNCSFDFYDSVIGVALKKETLEFASGIWITEQVDGAEAPAKDWIDFFIKILVENVVNSPKSFGIPIYIFVNNDSEMVIVPTKMD